MVSSPHGLDAQPFDVVRLVSLRRGRRRPRRDPEPRRRIAAQLPPQFSANFWALAIGAMGEMT